MEISFEVFLTILGMALVTYSTRIGGSWLINRATLSKRVERWLSYLPGTILIAIVGPEILRSGLAGIIAGLVTALVALRSGSLLLAMLTGVASIWLLRLF